MSSYLLLCCPSTVNKGDAVHQTCGAIREAKQAWHWQRPGTLEIEPLLSPDYRHHAGAGWARQGRKEVGGGSSGPPGRCLAAWRSRAMHRLVVCTTQCLVFKRISPPWSTMLNKRIDEDGSFTVKYFACDTLPPSFPPNWPIATNSTRPQIIKCTQSTRPMDYKILNGSNFIKWKDFKLGLGLVYSLKLPLIQASCLLFILDLSTWMNFKLASYPNAKLEFCWYTGKPKPLYHQNIARIANAVQVTIWL